MIAGTTMPAAARRRTGSGLACLVAAGLLWGTGGLTGSLLGRSSGLPALSVAAYRLMTGGALIIAFLVLTGQALARRARGLDTYRRHRRAGGDVPELLLHGCGADLGEPGHARHHRQRPGPRAGRRTGAGQAGRRLAGGATGLALTGLALLAGLPSGGFPETVVLASAGMAVLAAAGFATLTLISARPVAGLDDLTAAGFGFALGGLLLLPAAVAAGGIGFTPGPVTLGLLAALGTGPTAVAYTLRPCRRPGRGLGRALCGWPSPWTAGARTAT